MRVPAFILRLVFAAGVRLAKLLASVVTGLIVGVLVVGLLNTRGSARERMVDLIGLALGAKPIVLPPPTPRVYGVFPFKVNKVDLMEFNDARYRN